MKLVRSRSRHLHFNPMAHGCRVVEPTGRMSTATVMLETLTWSTGTSSWGCAISTTPDMQSGGREKAQHQLQIPADHAKNCQHNSDRDIRARRHPEATHQPHTSPGFPRCWFPPRSGISVHLLESHHELGVLLVVGSDRLYWPDIGNMEMVEYVVIMWRLAWPELIAHAWSIVRFHT